MTHSAEMVGGRHGQDHGRRAVTALDLDLSSKFLAFAAVDEPTPFVKPKGNEELILGLTQPGRHILLTAALVAVTFVVLTHAVVLWRSGALPGIILGIGLGSIAANGIDRIATGVVQDWLSIGTITWNLADFGVLLFVAVYALHALRAVPGDTTQATGANAHRGWRRRHRRWDRPRE